MLIQDFLRRSAKLFPDVIAINDTHSQLTYAQLAQRVDACHSRFFLAGIAPGQHVVILGANSIDYVVVYFACAQIGAILVPMNAYLRAAEINWIMADCDPAAVVASRDCTTRLIEECGLALEGRTCFVMGDAISGWSPIAGDTCPHEWLDQPAHIEASARFHGNPNAVAIQMYTSGTTGTPKGVMLSHHNIVSVVLAWLHEMPQKTTANRIMQATPLFHVGGTLICLCAIASGSTLYILPRFDAPLALDILQNNAITHTLLVPSMIQQLLLLPGIESCDFPHLEVIMYGASPIAQSVLSRAMNLFGCDFLQGYGLTETAGVALSLRPADHRFAAGSEIPARTQSAGRELLCCDVRVVDAHGRSVAVNEIGEIAVHGDNVTAGYWNNPAATAATIVDGWLRTGDLGRIDEHGYIYVVDRLKDMIIVSGVNVYPAEVENVLSSHPAVAEVAVIGLPNFLLGEEVVAVVVQKTAPSPQLHPRLLTPELKAFCHQHLAPFKCPVRVRYLDSLPRTPAGKILKNVLRERFKTETSA